MYQRKNHPESALKYFGSNLSELKHTCCDEAASAVNRARPFQDVQ